MSLAHSPSIVTNGLVMYVDAANVKSYPGSGTAWSDLSGNGNNGTLVNTPGFDSTYSGSFTFNGTNNEVTTTTQFTNPQTFSIGAWFKTSTAGGKKIIGFESNQTGTGSASFDRAIYINTDGTLYFYLYAPIGGSKTATSPLTYADNNWHYVLATYGGEADTMRLYVDGVSVATQSAVSAQNYNGWWRIAGYRGGGDGYFTGNISNAHVYNRGISAAEVSQNFNALRGRFGI